MLIRINYWIIRNRQLEYWIFNIRNRDAIRNALR